MKVTLIFPHQLFQHHPALQKPNTVYLVEEWLFFKQYKFHKQKIILHRASMQYYKHWLQKKGYAVEYIESNSDYSEVRKLVVHLKNKKITG